MILKAVFPIEDISKIKKLLTKISNLKSYAKEEKQGLSIEVVFMGEAVKLLLIKNVAYRQLSERLEEYGVTIAVCKKAIKANSLSVKELIVAAQPVASGVGEVIQKQLSGWAVYWC